METIFGLPWWGWLVLGLLVGLVLEWLFDRWSNQRVICEQRDQNVALQAENDRLKADVAALPALRAENERLGVDVAALPALRAETDGLRTELVGLRGTNDTLSGKLRLYDDDVSAFSTGGSNLALKTGLGAGLGAWLLATFGKDSADAIKADIDTLRSQNAALTADLADCRAHGTQLSADLETARGELKGYQEDIGALNGGAGADTLKSGLGAALGGWFGSKFGRNNSDEVRGDLDGLRSQNASLTADLAGLRDQQISLQTRNVGLSTELEALRAQNASLTADLEAARNASPASGLTSFGIGAAGAAAGAVLSGGDDEGDLRAQVVSLREQLDAERGLRVTPLGLSGGQFRDPLIDINGIGPVYQQKLYDGGIYTFKQLCGSTPEAVMAIIKPASWQEIDAQGWIDEACSLAGRPAAGATYGFATLGADGDSELVRLRDENAQLRAELAAERGPAVMSNRRDPLIDINGIGPVYEQKLFDAGIYTFKQLSESDPTTVRAIIKPQPWQEIDAAAWIAEAARLASSAASGRDPLIDINGIGPVYERKLFDAGVYTFKQLSEMTPEAIRAIIKPQPWQEFDAPAWIAEAAVFAKKYNG